MTIKDHKHLIELQRIYMVWLLLKYAKMKCYWKEKKYQLPCTINYAKQIKVDVVSKCPYKTLVRILRVKLSHKTFEGILTAKVTNS